MTTTPSSAKDRSVLCTYALFARNFFRHPGMLGSIVPSSPLLVARLLSGIDWRRARVIVEYGPGVGTFTRTLLRRMHPDATLIVFETNEDFVIHLRRTYPDPRLHIVHGSAVEIRQVLESRGLAKADYIVAGIPFSTLPGTERQRILDATRQAIAVEGAVLIYQFSPAIRTDLRQRFAIVRHRFEPTNFLPAHFFICKP
ncbi:MAG: methyltransferase [Halomonas sp.]|nr:methyltransferase [Halomonas sp.]